MLTFSSVRTKLGRLAALSLVVVSLAAPGVASAEYQPRDANASSIIYNGAYTKTEWVDKVHNGDGYHSAADIQHIYFNESRGITEANFTSSDTVDGTVFKDGHVEVAGKTVATGGLTVGREQVDGATASGTVWETPTATVFLSPSIPAFVNMQGGTFHYAVIKSCGNPVRGTAVQPSPTPTPTPTITPTPAPEQSFSCVKLTASQPDKNKPNTYRFSVNASVKGVSLTGYRFTVAQQGSGQAADVKDITNATNYADYTLGTGTWNVNGQVKTSAGITEITPACTAQVTVASATPTPTPTGQVLGTSLPATGPEAMLGGVAGLTAMGYAARGYVRSRKSVMDALRGKTNVK